MSGEHLNDGDLGGDLTRLREHNIRQVLANLAASPEGLTQQEIAAKTGLSRTTTSSLIADLRHVVVSDDREGSERGRPARVWRLDPKSAYSVGVDIGQTHVGVALTDPFGARIGDSRSVAVEGVLERPHHVLGIAAEMVRELIAESGIACEDIAAVTVGLPGAVDANTGILADVTAPEWSKIDVRDEIRKRWPHATIPARLADNSANLGAIAEHRLGAGRGARSLLFVRWSTGISAGLMLGNRPWRGDAGMAGELGHLPVTASAGAARILGIPPRRERDPCPRCGQTDCLERLAGGPKVAAAAGVDFLSEVVRVALDPAAPGAEKAQAALQAAAHLIGKAIGPALTLVNCQRVILGGMVGNRALYPLLVEEVTSGIAETAFPPARSASLELGALGADAPVLGAAISGFDEKGIAFLVRKAEAKLAPSGEAETAAFQ